MCKGLCLCGGSGTRLFPITKGIPKSMVPIYDKPMVCYPISTLMIAGIKDILIITTPEEQPLFKRLLGDGSNFGVHFEYAVQDKPNGIAEAFIIGEKFIGNDDVCLILGDNIFHGPNMTKMFKRAIANASTGLATIFGYHVNDPERYGVVEFEKIHDEYSVKSIEEKPREPKSNYAVVGLYFYPNSVVQMAKTITPSARGELEITEVNNRFLNYELTYYKYDDIGYTCVAPPLDEEQYGKPSSSYTRKENRLLLEIFDRGSAWLDTGTFESLSEASNYIETVEKRQGLKVACLEEIAYNKKWISKEKLLEIGNSMSKNEYGQYLINLVKGK